VSLVAEPESKLPVTIRPRYDDNIKTGLIKTLFILLRIWQVVACYEQNVFQKDSEYLYCLPDFQHIQEDSVVLNLLVV